MKYYYEISILINEIKSSENKIVLQIFHSLIDYTIELLIIYNTWRRDKYIL